MVELLNRIAGQIEKREPAVHCFVDQWNCQIIVSFDKRPDTQVALLTPYAQKQIKKGYLEDNLFTEMMFEVKRISNWSVA